MYNGSGTSEQTTKTRTKTSCRTTIITLAVHPWWGESVSVLRIYGRSAVWVEREDGDVRIVPISWTALVPRLDVAGTDGRKGRLSPGAALALSRWIEARREGT